VGSVGRGFGMRAGTPSKSRNDWRYSNAEAHLVEMARLDLTLDQPHFEAFINDQLKQDPRFLSQEELKRLLADLDQP
jgi:hypothetical protein